MNESIEHRLQQVRRRIGAAEARAGRAPGSVTLLAVSKTHPAEQIRQAWAAGQRAFGENYLQDALDKQGGLADLDIEWHYIGRIQSNKTRPLAESFHWVHGLTEAKHARRLNDQRPRHLPPLNLCIQVNVSGEASKGGLEPQAVEPLLQQCLTLPRLRLRGLMAIPAPATDEAARRAPLRQLRLLRDRLARPGLPLETLSMGMSGDLEEAIAEGATLVRIGTAIFGPRDYG